MFVSVVNIYFFFNIVTFLYNFIALIISTLQKIFIFFRKNAKNSRFFGRNFRFCEKYIKKPPRKGAAKQTKQNKQTTLIKPNHF